MLSNFKIKKILFVDNKIIITHDILLYDYNTQYDNIIYIMIV